MRLGFQALCLEMIPEALAAPMVVALRAQLMVVADIRTGEHVATQYCDVCNDFLAGVTLV